MLRVAVPGITAGAQLKPGERLGVVDVVIHLSPALLPGPN